MPRLNVRMSEGTRELLERLSLQGMDSSLNQTIIKLIESAAKVAPERRQSGASPRASASFPSEKNNIKKNIREVEANGFNYSENLSFRKEKNSNKAPSPASDFMPDPDNWEPSGPWRAKWCSEKGYDYAVALEIFREKYKASPQRCSDWDAKWKVYVLNGYLSGAKYGNEEDSYGTPIGSIKGFPDGWVPPYPLKEPDYPKPS